MASGWLARVDDGPTMDINTMTEASKLAEMLFYGAVDNAGRISLSPGTLDNEVILNAADVLRNAALMHMVLSNDARHDPNKEPQQQSKDNLQAILAQITTMQKGLDQANVPHVVAA